jgi:hypothetical protein
MLLLRPFCFGKRGLHSFWFVVNKNARKIYQNAVLQSSRSDQYFSMRKDICKDVLRTRAVSGDLLNRSIATENRLYNKQEAAKNREEGEDPAVSKTLMSKDEQKNAVGRPKSEYKCFYYFPPINIIRLIQRFQLLVYVTLLPASMLYIHTVPSPSIQMTLFVAANVLLMPAVFFMMPKMIGSLSAGGTSDIVDTLKVSRLSFFGNRKDTYYKIEHVKPLSEVRHANIVYAKFELYNKKEKFYLFHSYSKILDRQMFEIIMGRLKE